MRCSSKERIGSSARASSSRSTSCDSSRSSWKNSASSLHALPRALPHWWAFRDVCLLEGRSPSRLCHWLQRRCGRQRRCSCSEVYSSCGGDNSGVDYGRDSGGHGGGSDAGVGVGVGAVLHLRPTMPFPEHEFPTSLWRPRVLGASTAQQALQRISCTHKVVACRLLLDLEPRPGVVVSGSTIRPAHFLRSVYVARRPSGWSLDTGAWRPGA